METQSEQGKMDQLMAELQGGMHGESSDTSTSAADAETVDPGEELSEQEKMDQLMSELQGEAGGAAPGASTGEPALETNDPVGELSEQEKMDQLMAELQGEAGGEPPGESTDDADLEADDPVMEPSEQEKMDQLMAELQGEANADDEGPAAQADASETADPEDEPGEPEKIDQRMDDPQDGDAPVSSEAVSAAAPPEKDDPDEALSEQEKMDRLMAGLQGDSSDRGALQPQDPGEVETAADDDESESAEEPSGAAAADEDEIADEFQPLDDDEDGLDGYDDQGADQEPAAVSEPDAAVDPDPDPGPKPVARERKTLFKDQEERVSALPESSRQRQWPRIVILSAGLTILLAGLFAGLVFYLNAAKNSGPAAPDKAAAGIAETPAKRPAEAPSGAAPELPAAPETGATRAAVVDNPGDSIINDRFETIDTLRQSLQIKQAEITKLKKEYEAGIEESLSVVAELAAEQQIKDFAGAMAVRRIALELQTIQRRRDYNRKLDGPYKRLLAGSEALLYIKRLTEVDLAVAPFAGGLGTGQLLKRIDSEIDRHQLTSDKLLVAAGDDGAPALESLWKEALLKVRKMGSGEQAAADRAGGSALPAEAVKLTNEQIWEQICSGQPDHKYRLTELSSEAAACLAKWKGKELFLNRLRTLTSRQARALAEWPGEWIGLNGLTEMDRATARALFKWQGERLSLNGFAEFTPGIARYLPKWKGKQLELMGLETLSHRTAVYFSEWKKNGGKLYIPNQFYRRK